LTLREQTTVLWSCSA